MQIEFITDIDSWENDIRNLLMAFFPGAGVKRLADEAERTRADDCLFYSVCADAGQTADDKEAKNEMKRSFYRRLSRETGRELPWGTLTGIRPAKLVRMMLDEGRSEEECTACMRQEMLCSKKKTALSLEIAKRELSLIRSLDGEEGYSLYVGVPFCPTICAYCSFSSNPVAKYFGQVDAYLDCVEKELDWTASLFSAGKLNTIYVGGGTPTSIEPQQLDRLLGAIEARFDLGSLKEWTVEAGRPDSITPEKLEAIRRHPVSRISINPQTMKEETLKLIGRRHTVAQVKEAFRLARSMGFDNINMDMIVGLPDETKDDVARTLQEIAALSPDSLTVHSLAIKRAARLNTEKESFTGHTSVNSEEIMEMTENAARSMGLAPYYLYRQKNMTGNMENVGYARPGCEGIYNILIMEEVQSIVAAGAGSISKRVWADGLIERCANVKEVSIYRERIDEMIERKQALFSRTAH